MVHEKEESSYEEPLPFPRTKMMHEQRIAKQRAEKEEQESAQREAEELEKLLYELILVLPSQHVAWQFFAHASFWFLGKEGVLHKKILLSHAPLRH